MKTIRVGTRGSKLALIQTNATIAQLQKTGTGVPV